MMDRQQHSFGLHTAALHGDAESFHMVLDLGADINALDDAGRTVLMCAVAGERWEEIDASDASFVTPGRLKVIQTIIEHPDVTLYTLNAPQNAANGVTPLGMASWLNSPQAVQCLLDGSRGAVSVNGMDSHAATPLMYAARDGSMDVTRLLLSNGARPDFRDRNHRTSIQFSLAHPHVLWECEVALRQHRFKESQHSERSRLLSSSENLLALSESFLSACPKQISLSTPPAQESTAQLTQRLIHSILSSDSASVQSLLFSCSTPSPSPLLVNRPDCNGWSPIHHCASSSHLSVTTLDALYCAGADVSLFTPKEHYTPLHCLARSARLSEDDVDPSLALYQFTVHLIRDLQCPLSARDKHDETCIHIAAEHGSCLDLLMIFLECDTTGSIRELRNSRGLTALEVAKPEFRVAFGDDCDRLRSVSSLSNHTIRALRPTASLTSIVSFSGRLEGFPTSRDTELALVHDGDISVSSQQLITKLRSTSPNTHHVPSAENIDGIMDMLVQSRLLGKVVLEHYRSRAEDVVKDLSQLRIAVAHVNSFLDSVCHSVDKELDRHGLQSIRMRGGRFRESQDSQATAVAGDDEDYVHIPLDKPALSSGESSPKSTSSKHTDACSIAIQNACLDLIRSATKESNSPPSFFRSFSGFGSTQPVRLATLIDEEEAFISASATPLEVPKAHHEISEKSLNFFKRTWKSWFVKKSADGKPSTIRSKPQLTIDTTKANPLSLTTDTVPEQDDRTAQAPMPLRTAYVVLDAARRDIQKIEEILIAADQFMSTAHHSINRAERVIDRAIKTRHTALDTLQQLYSYRNEESSSPSPHLNRSVYLLAPSPSSSLSSANSSCISLAATLTENDDDDIRAIRRLLLRKIEASLGGSMDELSKVAEWLPLIKEATASIKRRTCL